jgi:hypothetical protein
MSVFRVSALALLFGLVTASRSLAQDRPYFVTYDHYLEEPRNLEIAIATTTGIPRNDERVYTAPWLELEYGVTGWWTAELYLEGVTTHSGGGAITGWRVENRFRPLRDEHRVNPVLYVEYENLNEASRIQKEIVGSGSLPFEPIGELVEEHAHELEAKLILSSAIGAWNVSENFIVERNLSENEGFEFGYSVGIARHLGRLASATPCRLCPENFVVGIEAYGGLGSSEAFARSEQRHYVAPVVSWRVSDRSTVKASVGFGLTPTSDHALVRIGYAYELPTRRSR